MADVFREKWYQFAEIHTSNVFGVADSENECKNAKFKMVDRKWREYFVKNGTTSLKVIFCKLISLIHTDFFLIKQNNIIFKDTY